MADRMIPGRDYCEFCGLIDFPRCRTKKASENCPHDPSSIPHDELKEIERLILPENYTATTLSPC